MTSPVTTCPTCGSLQSTTFCTRCGEVLPTAGSTPLLAPVAASPGTARRRLPVLLGAGAVTMSLAAGGVSLALMTGSERERTADPSVASASSAMATSPSPSPSYTAADVDMAKLNEAKARAGYVFPGIRTMTDQMVASLVVDECNALRPDITGDELLALADQHDVARPILLAVSGIAFTVLCPEKQDVFAGGATLEDLLGGQSPATGGVPLELTSEVLMKAMDVYILALEAGDGKSKVDLVAPGSFESSLPAACQSAALPDPLSPLGSSEITKEEFLQTMAVAVLSLCPEMRPGAEAVLGTTAETYIGIG